MLRNRSIEIDAKVSIATKAPLHLNEHMPFESHEINPLRLIGKKYFNRQLEEVV